MPFSRSASASPTASSVGEMVAAGSGHVTSLTGARGSPSLLRRQQLIDDRLLQLTDALLVARVDDKSPDLARLDQPDVEEHLHLLVERRLRASQVLEELLRGH